MPLPVTVYQDRLSDVIRTDSRIDVLASDCQFTEGPVWNNEGFYLFSDIPANSIFKIIPGKEKEVYLQQSGTSAPDDPDINPGQCGSNGLAYDHEGRLLVCRHGDHSLARLDSDGLHPFVTHYGDKRLNSPNDLVCLSNGVIYFSDPPYGLKDGKPNAQKFQEKARVYQWKEGELQVVCDDYQYPNGVCVSPDESVLFVCSNKPFEPRISCFETATNTFLHVFAAENSDGIKCDRRGNVYLCNKDGIIILDPEGKRMGLIQLPAVPANICWGGTDSRDLFITARQYVLVITGLIQN